MIGSIGLKKLNVLIQTQESNGKETVILKNKKETIRPTPGSIARDQATICMVSTEPQEVWEVLTLSMNSNAASLNTKGLLLFDEI